MYVHAVNVLGEAGQGLEEHATAKTDLEQSRVAVGLQQLKADFQAPAKKPTENRLVAKGHRIGVIERFEIAAGRQKYFACAHGWGAAMRIIHLRRRTALVDGHAPKLANARSF